MLVLAFAPQRFAGADAFLRQTTWLADAARSNRPADPAKPVRLPGQLALERKRQAEREGLVLPDLVAGKLAEFAAKVGIALPT